MLIAPDSELLMLRWPHWPGSSNTALLRVRHLGRVCGIVEVNIALNPTDVRLFGFVAVIPSPNFSSHLC